MPSHAASSYLRQPTEAGFTLSALSLVLLVIGVGAAFAVPAYKNHVEAARRDETVRQLGEIANAFQTYAKEHGDWPVAGLPPKAIPEGMQRYLAGTNWQETTPIGGSYQWVTQTPQNGGRYAAAILITSADPSLVSHDRRLLSEIDKLLDDGDLAEGKFFLGYRGLPVYVLEH